MPPNFGSACDGESVEDTKEVKIDKYRTEKQKKEAGRAAGKLYDLFIEALLQMTYVGPFVNLENRGTATHFQQSYALRFQYGASPAWQCWNADEAPMTYTLRTFPNFPGTFSLELEDLVYVPDEQYRAMQDFVDMSNVQQHMRKFVIRKGYVHLVAERQLWNPELGEAHFQLENKFTANNIEKLLRCLVVDMDEERLEFLDNWKIVTDIGARIVRQLKLDGKLQPEQESSSDSSDEETN